MSDSLPQVFVLEVPSYFSSIMYFVSSTHSILTSFMFFCVPSIFQYLTAVILLLPTVYLITKLSLGCFCSLFLTQIALSVCSLFCVFWSVTGRHYANRRKIIEVAFHKDGKFRVLCFHFLLIFQINHVNHIVCDSVGFWQWYITFGTIQFLDSIICPVFFCHLNRGQ